MPYAPHQGVRMHYQVEGEGPPLVLLHGFNSSLERWYESGYVEPLQHDYHLILIDARGHGASDKPHERAAYAWPIPVADVVAVLDHLQMPQAHVLGYSMGGRSLFRPRQIRADSGHVLTYWGYARRGKLLCQL